MAPVLTVALKISLVLFMAGNLLEMGLKLDPRNALRGLRDARFVVGRARPVIKGATRVATISTAVLCVVYGNGLLGITGSLAVASQVLFFGLPNDRRIVLNAGPFG